ncbi:alpha-mannosidase [Ruania zhangjianzhongii]|uniref:glycoside hydrolase family 38 N-terminal domain-containing protein n=1 Tax=Ruania zhangjianzhongii TaxID=2603206 RepID=UPI0011CC7A7A|nr:alpha-mannosidase [Ruania zhangjianzhongii]
MTDADPAAPGPTDPASPTDAGIALVPHTHWDREWYEPHEVFRLRLVHVLDDVITRLEADPQFRFTLDGQTAAIEDYLQIRPEMRERVAVLVRGGQLAVGPWLILLDEFCCDGETIVRNLELGIDRAERLGGAMGVGYLPDMFGHTAQMPQILRGFGIEHAALWRGVPAAVTEHSFTWQSPDGSSVRTEYLFDGYGSALDLFALPDRLAELATAYREQTRPWYGQDPVLGMFGTDHMAPPPELMDRVRAHNAGADAPQIRVATLSEVVMSEVRHGAPLTGRPEVVAGELRSHARGNLLPGVFSIRTNLKAAMAEAELTLTQAERLDALYSAEDHRSFFDLAWYRVVESTAHDSITGCGVDETADQVAARLASAAQIGRAVSERVLDGLAADVPSDAYLLANTLPWARTVQTEVVVAGDDGGGSGGQVVGELDTALGDETMTSAELVSILRRIHGRELFGQQINGYTWGADSLHFTVGEVAEGPFDLATLTAEIEAAATADPEGRRHWQVVTTAQPRRRVILAAEVPPLGHVSIRAASGAGSMTTSGAEATTSPAQVRATPRSVTGDLVSAVVDADGTLTLTGTDGTTLTGVGRLVDEGDRGDSYNYGPLAHSPALETPTSVHTDVVAEGPVRAAIEVTRRYDLPLGVDPADRDRRLEKTEELAVRMLVEVRAGEPFVRLTLSAVNTVGDHRLRLHVPLGEQVDTSFGSGQFDVTRRGRTAEGGWGEYPLPTFPATGFVSAGNAHVLLAKLTEYEVVGGAAGDELALTLLRAVGMMSVNVHPLRDEPAGSEIPVPGAQYLGTEVSTRLAVLPRAGGWERAEVARWAEHFRHEPLVVRGHAAAGGALPAAAAGPELTGPAVLSSLRQVGDGGASVVEARLVSMSSAEQDVRLTAPDGAAWQVTDLRGRPSGVAPDAPLRAGEVRTLRA